MTNFIPIFPLNIVVYPNEHLNLHIFEDRYKQLIRECYEEKKTFGIPSVLKGKISDMGCSVEILSIAKEHDNGNLDIKTIGRQVFTILDIIHEVPDKLYSGAIVHYPENNTTGIQRKMKLIMNELRHFHFLLEVSKVYTKSDDEMTVYDIAHHAGLSLEQEYELLNLLREDQRQEYLQRHLKAIIPTIMELKNLKDRIQLNGHFRKLSVDDN
ncbi:MAG: LON peptidase substrate-binding domain-containing protein [Chitinophagaceae bacterium]|nr:LON peptidase substrate-binding domain-containing protein [Chitinophagaceae bacterium]